MIANIKFLKLTFKIRVSIQLEFHKKIKDVAKKIVVMTIKESELLLLSHIMETIFYKEFNSLKTQNQHVIEIHI